MCVCFECKIVTHNIFSQWFEFHFISFHSQTGYVYVGCECLSDWSVVFNEVIIKIDTNSLVQSILFHVFNMIIVAWCNDTIFLLLRLKLIFEKRKQSFSTCINKNGGQRANFDEISKYFKTSGQILLICESFCLCLSFRLHRQ